MSEWLRFSVFVVASFLVFTLLLRIRPSPSCFSRITIQHCQDWIGRHCWRHALRKIRSKLWLALVDLLHNSCARHNFPASSLFRNGRQRNSHISGSKLLVCSFHPLLLLLLCWLAGLHAIHGSPVHRRSLVALPARCITSACCGRATTQRIFEKLGTSHSSHQENE